MVVLGTVSSNIFQLNLSRDWVGTFPQDWQQSASVLQLFAYPEDRRLPWASLSVFLASSAATLTFAAMWQQVNRKKSTIFESLKVVGLGLGG